MNKIDGYTGLVKEDAAVINVDYQAYLTAKRRKELFKNMQSDINSLRSEVNKLKADIALIIERLG